MSNKLGLMFSMLFIVMFFTFGVDIINVQFVVSDLDAKSVAISYLISDYGTIDDSLVERIETNYNVDFTCKDNCNPQFGDVVNYTISRSINTMIMKKGPMIVSIERTAVIGYFA